MTIKLLEHYEYIKLNSYLYLKNIKSHIITGSIALVNLLENSCTYLTITNKFLFFNSKLNMSKIYFNNIVELDKILTHNMQVEQEYVRKYRNY